MLSLNKTFQTIAGQLRGFSSSARLLIGALVVILLMSLALVALYAGRADMVPLGLSASFDTEARTRAATFLDARGIEWVDVGGDIHVPAEERYAVLAQLTENRLITGDQIDFGAILKDESPFTDRQTRKSRYLVIKMNEVARMISEMSGIERANVVIDQPDRSGGLGSPRIPPTASVTVLASGDRLAQTRADAIARIVAGAHAELKVENVTIVDARTGRAITARGTDDFAATKYLETKLAHEKAVKDKIELALSVFPGVVVAVNALVDATEEVQSSRTYDPPKVGVLEEEVVERASQRPPVGGEPGVRSNVGAEIGGGAALATTSDNRSSARNANVFGSQESHRTDPRGYAVQINATVLVPQSYLVRLHQGRAGDPTVEPDQATLTTLGDEVREQVRRLVEPLIDTGTMANAVPGRVVVSMFADVATIGLDGPGAGGVTAGGGGGLVSRGVIELVGLGVLAVVSLLLMMMMVRKAARPDDLPTAEALAGVPPALAESDGDLVGEADEGIAAMEGVEIGEEAVRRQQMLDQINDLVSASPDDAATLLRRWIKTDD